MFQSKRMVGKSCGKTILGSLAVTLLFALVNAAFGLEEGPVNETLGPVDRPTDEVVGLEWHAVRDGEPYVDTTVAVDGETVTSEDSNGCKYTNLQFAFAPSLEWENCNGKSGTQTITKTKGSPWPMQLKNKFSYNFKGKYKGGDSWKGRRTCKVKEQVRVSVPAGEFDTYKIVCTDPWNTRTWWFAPGVNGGTTVAYKRHHKYDSTKNTRMEMTKVVSP